jgi:uncharacterized membrane protein
MGTTATLCPDVRSGHLMATAMEPQARSGRLEGTSQAPRSIRGLVSPATTLNPGVKSGSGEWVVPALLVVFSLIPALAGSGRLFEVAGDATSTPENARFLNAPLPIMIHIPAATIFSILGAFQFSPALRRRNAWHRVAGRTLVPAALLVAISGLWMTLTYPWPANDGVAVYVERLVFGTAMLLSVIMGADAIRRRKFVEHGDWMIRAYAIGLGAGTQVFTHLPWFILVDMHPGELPRSIMMGLGWVINVIVAEWIIGRSRAPRVHEHQGARLAATTAARTPGLHRDAQHRNARSSNSGPVWLADVGS